MSRNQQCDTMLLLICMFLMTMMIAKTNVAAYTFNEVDSSEESDRLSLQRLRHLARKLQWDNEDLFFESRADPVGDCTADIIEGYEYVGPYLPPNYPGIPTAQRCMDKCDVNAQCVGWSYNVDSKWCWFYSSITGYNKRPEARSGTCIGTSLKTKCTETNNGNYNGDVATTLSNIDTMEDCMAKCDQSPLCLAWVYYKDGKECSFFERINEFLPGDYFVAGSCIASQNRIRVGDPIKLFQNEALDRHNEKRKKHCVPELTMDDDLNKIAQDRANELATVDETPPTYDRTKMVTVLYRAGDSALNGAIPVDCFYDENKGYNWDSPDFSRTSHFPKVIWKNSRKMGVGRSFDSDNNTMYIVTTYDWEGDISASYKDNVLPTCS